MSKCTFCGVEVNLDSDDTFTEQTVFVAGPKKNGSVLATDTGRYACKACIERVKAGQAPDQPNLFD